MPRKKSPKALRKTVPAHLGRTWEEVEASMLESPADADVLAELERRLVVRGGFAQPIVLDPMDVTVLDGTHRVVAALRTGIPIDVVWSAEVEQSDDDVVCEVTFRCEVIDEDLARSWSEEEERDLRGFMAVVNALGSVPTADGWLSCAVFSGGPDRECRGTWWSVAGPALPDDEALIEILESRARRAGVSLVVISTDRNPEWLHDG